MSLPNWDIIRADRWKEALEYMNRCDPDLLVAWPCGPRFGHKTEQIKNPGQRERRQGFLLQFVKQAARDFFARVEALCVQTMHKSP